MAITVNLYYTGTKGSAAAFAQEMIASGTVEAIRLEEGNLQYEYFQPLEDPETILLIDSWQDQQALDRHHASPMMTPKISAQMGSVQFQSPADEYQYRPHDACPSS